ncbi:unnamed protein product [Closterium sp. Naga37s-1]|nr:unnamed protein product [Closterium sp. Naga37s-1]
MPKVQKLHDACRAAFVGSQLPDAQALQRVRTILDAIRPADVGLEAMAAGAAGAEGSPVRAAPGAKGGGGRGGKGGARGQDSRRPGPAPAAAAAAAVVASGGKQARWSPAITYLHVYECEDFSIGIFCLPASARIPLHNHPGMTVLSKLLYGSMHIRSFDWVRPIDDAASSAALATAAAAASAAAAAAATSASATPDVHHLAATLPLTATATTFHPTTFNLLLQSLPPCLRPSLRHPFPIPPPLFPPPTLPPSHPSSHPSRCLPPTPPNLPDPPHTILPTIPPPSPPFPQRRTASAVRLAEELVEDQVLEGVCENPQKHPDGGPVRRLAELVEDDSAVCHHAGAALHPTCSELVEDQVLTAPCATEVLHPTCGGNLHAFTAVTPCALLVCTTLLIMLVSLNLPNHSPSALCSLLSFLSLCYLPQPPHPLRLLSGALPPGVNGERGNPFCWLEEFQPSDDFVVQRGHYRGPKVCPSFLASSKLFIARFPSFPPLLPSSYLFTPHLPSPLLR